LILNTAEIYPPVDKTVDKASARMERLNLLSALAVAEWIKRPRPLHTIAQALQMNLRLIKFVAPDFTANS
jgi:hypothetical protein